MSARKGRFFVTMSFYIKIANGLLDPKHCLAMGEAVWLYMWLQDKNTSINDNGEGKVLGNKPITYEDVKPMLGMSRRTYVRWIDKLRQAGYIKTVRTPTGLLITITKAKKFRPSDVSHMAQQSKSDVPQMTSDVPNLVSDVPKSSIQYKTIQLLYKDYNNTTDVVLGDPPKTYGKPAINDLFDFWEETTGNKITSQVKQNRNAANNLIKKHGDEVVRRMIGGVAYSHGHRYAPMISNFTQLQAKWDELIVWGKKQGKTHGTKALDLT